MKTSRKILSVAFGLAFASSAFADNPIIQTYYSPDPAPVVFGDTVCVYTGNDEGGSFFTMHGWRVSCTTDMVNWTDMNTLILEAGDFNGNAKKNGDWASQCIRRNDKYYYYVTVESTMGGRAVNVAVSDTKEGPFKDARNGKHLAGPNWDYIDPTVFIDDDGQAYLYWGNPKLYYCPLKENMTECDGDIKVTDMSKGFNGKYTEGPWIHKRGKKYYMIYAAGGIPESIDYSWSDSPTGPWEYKGVIMPSNEPGSAFTVHSGLIDFKGHSYFFYHNQRRVPGAGGYSRTSAVEEFTWKEDGTLPTIRMTDDGVTKPVKNLDPYTRVEAETKAWLEGINLDKSGGYTIIKNIETEGKRVYLTNMGKDSYTKVRFVDMSDGADNIVVCTKGNGGKIELHSGSATGTLLSTINVPSSTDWEENSFEVTGADGVADLYFVFKEGNFKFDYWYFESNAQAVPQEPFKGTAFAVPGKIEAEDYNKSGVGRGNKSFYDADAENQGGAYREDAVDIVGFDCSDSANTKDCKGYALGYTSAGEWLTYTVDVKTAGVYEVSANMATPGESEGIKLYMDDKAITGDIIAKQNGENDWSTYTAVSAKTEALTAGEHLLKLEIVGNNVNVDWLKLCPETGCVEESAGAADDTTTTLVQNIRTNFVGNENAYNVFSMTGKFMGRINMVSNSISESLKMAGFVPGTYVVRGIEYGKTFKVNALR
ncbi:MAG: family 43 glycosylhydrolase [Fibrobacter sp.]|nr:family 43 glycosylhydrolase [Fibrobacter sp.]